MFRQSSWLPIGVCVALFALALPASTSAQGICRPDVDGDVAKVFYEPDAIYWDAIVDHDRLILRVDAPCDTIEKVFKRGETPFFELREVLGPLDGSYAWELRVEPVVDADVREALNEAHETGDYSIVRKLQDQDRLPVGPFLEGEAFSVVEGRILQPTEGEEKSTIARRTLSEALTAPVVAASGELTQKDGNRLATKDVLHYDDVIVTGSLCVGFDCANGESFGYDTIKLKENNLRLYFEDTSVGTFPTGDWRIATNDTTSGGASYFAVEDVSNSRTPFRVETGAPNHALYVEDYGRVGLGTSIPYVELHIVDGDSPTVRLDQDGSSGFAAQKWDLAGNETNFFIRDVTNGSKLSFRIQPGAPSNSLAIRSDGDVGIGTWSPDAALDIERNGSGSAVTMLRLSNTNGPSRIEFRDDTGGVDWDFRTTSGDAFVITKDGTGTNEFMLQSNGNLTIAGEIFTDGSCSGGCDLVFSPETELESIEEHASRMWAGRHLPAVGPTPENGPFNLSRMAGGMLNELEKAHLYIEQLDRELSERDERIAGLEERTTHLLEQKDQKIEDLEARLEALEQASERQ